MLRVFFICSVILLAYGLFRPEPIPVLFNGFDLFAHAGSFFVVTLLGVASSGSRVKMIMVLSLFIFALLAEPAQHWLQPSRFYSVYDHVANVSGFFLGFGVTGFLHRVNTLRRLNRNTSF